MALTNEQIRHFRHNGYLKFDQPLPDSMVSDLKEAIWADIEAVVEPTTRDSNGRPVRLSQVLERAAIFRRAATFGPALDALQGLLGRQIELVKNRHNHATLNYQSAAGDHFHRDAMQWSRSLVTLVFYLEETTLDNGCTQLVPGTHLLPGLGYLHRLDEEEWVAASRLLHQAVPIPMPAGGILALDGLVFHRMGSNHTDGTRISMTMGYHSADELDGGDDPRRLLVRGQRPYAGNDRQT
ncbi:MAG: hypothetical protein GKR89_20875 [Candidatus Latescibacteria bacterium]|nr:hypothetical protein [Candidatus Latescibacterota bacterium]